jgi:hypothetical protein
LRFSFFLADLLLADAEALDSSAQQSGIDRDTNRRQSDAAAGEGCRK